jgi:hypothetical protein
MLAIPKLARPHSNSFRSIGRAQCGNSPKQRCLQLSLLLWDFVNLEFDHVFLKNLVFILI